MPDPIIQNETGDSFESMDAPNSLAHIRHTLRTPLNQILGYAEMIQEEHEQDLPPSVLEDLKKIHTAGGQLLALIQDRLAAWKFEMGRVDLASMRFEARTPLNLIIGYTELCEEVATEERLDSVIADLKKIGGAAKNLQALFASISFPDSIEVQRKMAEDTMEHTTFLTRSSVNKDSEEKLSGHILIIDDNEMNRDMLCRRLENQGFETSEAENGYQGVEMLKEN